MNAGDIAAQKLKSRTINVRADLHQNPFASDNTGLNFFTGNNDDTGYMLDVFTRTPADNALLDFGINPDDIKYNLENHIKEGNVLVNKIKNASSKNQVFQILKQYCPDDNTALQVFNYLMNITAQSNFSDYDSVSNDNPFKDRNKAYLMSALYTVQEGRLKPVYETKGAQQNDFDRMMTAVLPELVYQFGKEGTPDNIRNWCAETFGIGISDKDVMEEIRTAGAASRIYKSLNENNMNKARLLCRAELDTRLQNSKNMREVYDNLALYYGKDNAFKILEKTINAFKDKNGNICVRDEYLKTGHFPYAPYETSAMPVSAVPASKTRFSAAAIEQSDIPGIKNHNLKDKDAVYNFISRGGKNTPENRAEFEKISPLYQKWADTAVSSEEAQRINNAGEFCLNPENKQKINDCIEKYAEFAFQNDEIRSHYAKLLNQDKNLVNGKDIAEYIKKPENIAEESKKFMKYAFESSKEKLYGKSNLDGTVQEYCSEMAQWPSNFARRLSLALMAASYLPGAPVSGLMPASMGAQFSDDGIDLWNKLSNGQNYQDNNYEDFLKNVLLKAGIKAGYFALGGMANKAGNLFDAKFGKGIEAALNKCGIGGNFFRILAQNTAEAGVETAIGLPYTMMIKAVQGGKYDITAEFIENFIFDGLPYLRGGALFSGKPVIKPDGTKIDFEDSGGGRFRITETKTQWESDKQGGIKPVTTQSSRVTALDEQKGKLTVYDGENPEKVLYSIERDETGAAKLITPAEPAPKIEPEAEITRGPVSLMKHAEKSKPEAEIKKGPIILAKHSEAAQKTAPPVSDEEFLQLKKTLNEKLKSMPENVQEKVKKWGGRFFGLWHGFLTKHNINLAIKILNMPELCSRESVIENAEDILRESKTPEQAKIAEKILDIPALYKNEDFMQCAGNIVRVSGYSPSRMHIAEKILNNPDLYKNSEIIQNFETILWKENERFISLFENSPLKNMPEFGRVLYAAGCDENAVNKIIEDVQKGIVMNPDDAINCYKEGSPQNKLFEQFIQEGFKPQTALIMANIDGIADYGAKDIAELIESLGDINPQEKRLSEVLTSFLSKKYSGEKSKFLPELTQYIRQIDFDGIAESSSKIGEFTPVRKLLFADYHYKNGTEVFTPETLTLDGDLTEFLAKNYLNADSLTDLLAALPLTSRQIGSMPPGWIDGRDKTMEDAVYSAIDKFIENRNYGEFASGLAEITGKKAEIKKLGYGVFGSGYKISIEGCMDVCLKVFKPKKRGFDHNIHGEHAEVQTELFLNRHSDDYVKMFFGRVSPLYGAKPGFMVTQYLDENTIPYKNNDIEDASGYTIINTDTWNGHNTIKTAGGSIIIDAGGVIIKRDEDAQ